MSGFDDEDLLARELRERSTDVGGHPIELDAVRRSARRIQRRRALLTGAASAAVVAAVVPVGLVLGGTSTNGSGPANQATVSAPPSQTPDAEPSTPPSSSASPAPTVSTSPASSTPTGPATNGSPLTALAPEGRSPALTYLVLSGSTTTLHHGGTTDVLQGRYSDAVPYQGGWLAYGTGPGGSVISRFNTAGEPMDQRPGTDFVESDDGIQVAWVESGTLHSGLTNGHTDSEATQQLPGRNATAVGFAGGGVVYTLDGRSPTVHLTDLNGHDRVLPGLVKSWGVSQSAGLVGGETRYNADGTSCWQVARTDGSVLWHTCDWALGAFSRDGRYVVGTPSDGDGLGSPRVALLDAHTGKLAALFTAPAGSFAREFRWEDGDALLAVGYDAGRWTVLRLGVDGSVQRTLPAVAGSDVDPSYHLGWY